MKRLLILLTFGIFLLNSALSANNKTSYSLTDSTQNQNVKCDCPKPYSDAKIQVQIKYGNDFLKLCSWSYDDNTGGINEFQIFDKNNNLIFDGFPPSEYKISELKSPLQIVQSTSLPNSAWKWETIPVYNIAINKVDSSFTLDYNFVFKAPKLTPSYQDSIFQIYNNQKPHNKKYDRSNPPFTNEKYIVNLFYCAVNDNKDCQSAYKKLNERFVTDGAIGELYYELLGILNSYVEKY